MFSADFISGSRDFTQDLTSAILDRLRGLGYEEVLSGRKTNTHFGKCYGC